MNFGKVVQILSIKCGLCGLCGFIEIVFSLQVSNLWCQWANPNSWWFWTLSRCETCGHPAAGALMLSWRNSQTADGTSTWIWLDSSRVQWDIITSLKVERLMKHVKNKKPTFVFATWKYNEKTKDWPSFWLPTHSLFWPVVTSSHGSQIRAKLHSHGISKASTILVGTGETTDSTWF